MLRLTFSLRLAATLLLFAFVTSAVADELYINELYWDPPSNPDTPREYIELRGTPGMSLANHYLLFLENEDRFEHVGATGEIETFFDLNGKTIGSNGFLTLRQRNSPFTPNPQSNDYINSSSFGTGWGADPASSTIGAWDLGGQGEIENSGFTAMLIRNDGAPMTTPQQHFALLGQDLDVGNDGLDYLITDDGPDWKIINPDIGRNWTIVDSIGVFGEAGEAGLGRTYAKINFGQEIPGQELSPSSGGIFNLETGRFEFVPRIEPGTTYVGMNYEIELLARWGNSTGQTAADWHVTNVTDELGSGSQRDPNAPSNRSKITDLRQSCIDGPGCHPDDMGIDVPPPLGLPTESNWGVPYGTQLTNTLGRPNFMLGDYNDDGYVDAADYVMWRKTFGQTASDLGDHPADANHDYVVDAADYTIWRDHFGGPGPGGGTGPYGAVYVAPLLPGSGSIAHGVPEPASLALFAVGGFALGISRIRRRTDSRWLKAEAKHH